ncbi:MAG: hypothetical protein COS35_10025, partial [Zetaproteobacteria bacterium CG02_land_8_20_14_3_00_50_9]
MLRKWFNKKKSASKSRKQRRSFDIDALEPRILLSADPLLGVVPFPLSKGVNTPQNNSPVITQTSQLQQSNTAPYNVTVDALRSLRAVTNVGVVTNVAQTNLTQTVTPATNNQQIILGDVAASSLPSGSLNVSGAQLQGSSGSLLVGGSQSANVIQVGDPAQNSNPVNIAGNLILQTPQNGGEIFINGGITGSANSTLTIYGSGHTTTWAGVSTLAAFNIADSSVINGAVSITATNGGIQLGSTNSHALNGLLDATPDSLTLSASGVGNNIIIAGPVGTGNGIDPANPLTALTITQATDVTFVSTVTMNGNLIINATGIVTFNQAVTMSSGSLTINGASQVIFQQGLSTFNGANILIEADEIDFRGGQSTVSGTGTLTLRSSTLGIATEIASPQAGTTVNVLNLTATEMLTLAAGFSSIVIGHQDPITGHALAVAGAIRIGSIGAFQATFLDNVNIYGGTIEITDYTNAGFTLQSSLNMVLDAVNDITISNETTAGGNLTLYSASGKITQLNNVADGVSNEVLKSANLTATATLGVNLPWISTTQLQATNVGSGDMIINAVAASAGVTVINVSQTLAVGAGNIVLSSEAGNLLVDLAGTGVTTVGTGNITISANGVGGTLTVNNVITAASGAVTLNSDALMTIAAVVSSLGAGNVALTSTNGDINQNATISTLGGAITLNAGAAITMADGTTTTSTGGGTGTISYTAVGNILLSTLAADGASVSVISSAGSIVDNLTGEASNLLAAAAAAILRGATGVGTSLDNINTTVASLSGGISTSGGMFVLDTDALDIAVAGIQGAGIDGSVIITTLNGAINVNGSIVTSGTVGNILIKSATTGAVADIALNAALNTTNGNVTVLSPGAVNQAATGGIQAGATIDVEALLGAVTMIDGAVSKATGNIRYAATTILTLASIDSAATVSLVAPSIVDGGDTQTDLIAASLLVTAATGVGSTLNAIESSVSNLSSNTGSIFLDNGIAMAISEVLSPSINRVAVDATTAQVTDAGSSDVISSGTVMIRSAATITVNDGGNLNNQGVLSVGNVLLQTTTGNIAINAAVNAGTGHITLLAA